MSIDLILLKLWALLRPLTMVEVNIKIMGLGFFEIVGIGFIGLLGLAILFRATHTHRFEITGIDIIIILYIFWVLCGMLVYPGKSKLPEVVKQITPFLTWFVVKTIIRNEVEYIKVIRLAFIGFAIILFINVFAILLLPETITVAKTPWNTKLSIYQGLYDNAGTLGLSVAALVLVDALHRSLRNSHASEIGAISLNIKTALISVVVFGSALFCLVKSQSRTAMLGIVVFYGIFYIRKNKKYLIALFGACVVILVVFAPTLSLIFNDFIRVYNGELGLTELGSGRPRIWLHNLMEFDKLPLERKLIGAGVGNTVPIFTWNTSGGESIWVSHNDYLFVIMHTGVIGFLLFIAFQLAILKKVLEYQGSEKWIFLSTFFSINLMNLSTNAFISRYPLAQISLLIFVYVDMKRRLQSNNETYRLGKGALQMRQARSRE